MVKFSIGSITNPLSFELTDSFKIYVSTTVQDNYYVNQIETGLSITNTQAGELTSVSLLPDSNQLNQTTNYAIYFTTKNLLPKNSYVDIKFPAEQFTNLAEVTCSAIKTAEAATTCALAPGTNNVIRITRAFQYAEVVANTEVAFLLWNVKNPSSSIIGDELDGQFSIMTVSSDGYPIDASYNLKFQIGCVFPCATCAAEQNKCLTCLRLEDGTQLNYFDKDKTCLPECPRGYRQNKLNVCEPCDQQCATCSKSATWCDSCSTTLNFPYLDISTGYCQKECPPGTYENKASLTCEPCVNNCVTCKGPEICIDCKPGYLFMEEGQCLDQCPVTAIQFGSNSCLACKEPCYTCEG